MWNCLQWCDDCLNMFRRHHFNVGLEGWETIDFAVARARMELNFS